MHKMLGGRNAIATTQNIGKVYQPGDGKGGPMTPNTGSRRYLHGRNVITTSLDIVRKNFPKGGTGITATLSTGRRYLIACERRKLDKEPISGRRSVALTILNGVKRKTPSRNNRYHNDPEHRQKILDNQRTPAARQRANQRNKKRRANDPEWRDEQNDKLRERYRTDPKYRERLKTNHSLGSVDISP